MFQSETATQYSFASKPASGSTNGAAPLSAAAASRVARGCGARRAGTRLRTQQQRQRRARRCGDAALRSAPMSVSTPAMIMAGTTCENIITAHVTARASKPVSAPRARLPRASPRARTYVNRELLKLLQARPRARRHRRRISRPRCARPAARRRLRRSHAPRRSARLPPRRLRVGAALLLPQPVPRLGRHQDADQRSRPLVPARRGAGAPRSAAARACSAHAGAGCPACRARDARAAAGVTAGVAVGWGRAQHTADAGERDQQVVADELEHVLAQLVRRVLPGARHAELALRLASPKKLAPAAPGSAPDTRIAPVSRSARTTAARAAASRRR